MLHLAEYLINWLIHKKTELNFVTKILRSFVLIPNSYVILVKAVDCGFIIDRLVTSQRLRSRLTKANHRKLSFDGENLNQKVYSLN